MPIAFSAVRENSGRSRCPREVATLVAKAFLGAESMLLLGIDEKRDPIRGGLRKIGDVIEARENANKLGEAP